MIESDRSTRHHPLVIAHRGVSSRAVENSLRAIRLAVENPWGACDGIEIDIHSTSDGQFAVHHNPALPSGRRLTELTMAQIRAELLVDGTPIPTLAEAIDAAGNLRVFIEVKGLDRRLDSRLIDTIIDSGGRDRCQIHSFDHRLVARLAGQAPELTFGVLSASYPIEPLEPVLMAGATVLWQEWGLIDGALLSRCQSAAVDLIAWTVNDSEVAARLAGMGVAGLCGNWPERLGAARCEPGS